MRQARVGGNPKFVGERKEEARMRRVFPVESQMRQRDPMSKMQRIWEDVCQESVDRSVMLVLFVEEDAVRC